ncbi:unnamed protein product [Didymodactylos carnosus]|uniref:G-protein coupled receptors family 1 profile domain-containing protein n=1 Tax=Didymodactylos carnosus TaxID=1234261 RepID=A0A815SVP7_9BILA|nr:unnamed protein product [Didymodactylos carnosus]CAF4358418.1 unnamed protein product [Didymodactylos carnosus]
MQSVFDLLLLYLELPARYLSEAFNIDITNSSQSYCKFYFITSDGLRLLSPSLLMWACLDRYLSSCGGSRYRQLAQMKLARYTIPITIIISFLLFSYVPFFYEVYQIPNTTIIVCFINGDRKTQFHLIYFSFVTALLPTILLVLFSLLTLKNVRHQRHQIQPINHSLHRRRDRQMVRLMLCQTFIYIAFGLPFLLISIYLSFTTASTTVLSSFVIQLCLLINYFDFVYSFYVNTLSASMYRKEFIKLLNKLMKILFRSTIIERRYLSQHFGQQSTSFRLNRITTLQPQTTN